jgi:type I restriction enzyme R subunit
VNPADFARRIHHALSLDRPSESVDGVKNAVIEHLAGLDDQMLVRKTEHFNHSFFPDLVASWPHDHSVSERKIFLRLASNFEYLIEDIEIIGDSGPIVFNLGLTPGDVDEALTDLLDARSVTCGTLVMDSRGVDRLLANQSSELLRLVSVALMRGGRGLVDWSTAAAISSTLDNGFKGALLALSRPTGQAIQVLDHRLSVQQSSYIQHILQEVWIGAGGHLDQFPGRKQRHEGLSTGTLQSMLGHRIVDDLKFRHRPERHNVVKSAAQLALSADAKNLLKYHESNFKFLEVEWPDLYGEVTRAERLAVVDPRAAVFYARRAVELAVTWMFAVDEMLDQPYQENLAAMLAEPTFVRVAGPAIRAKMDVIRGQGDAAVHRTTPVSVDDAMRVLSELFHIVYWLARTYSLDRVNLPEPGRPFDPTLVARPKLADIRVSERVELKKLAERFAAQQVELAAEWRRNWYLDAGLQMLRAKIKVAKAANQARVDTHDYREAETRTLIIELLLAEAGWTLDQPQDRDFPLSGLPESASKVGAGKADYVLWDNDGKPLAVVETKYTTRDAKAGQHQAKVYADALEKQFRQRPIIFYTSGYHIYLWDDSNYPPREVRGFYTKEELRRLVQRRAVRQSLAKLPINDQIAGRFYQLHAIRRVAEAFEEGAARRALLVMATGSGKTRTAIALTDLMMRANWVKRVLFLTDRNLLVKQAANAFKQQLPGVPVVNLLQEKNANAQVYVSSYPTLTRLINEVDESGARRYGPGYFDLIVVDEVHRSIYQKYGAISDYFDALLVGLTSTPKDEIDRNTYRKFQLEDGVATDVYSLEEAVADGYLVPARAVELPLKFERGGIKYADLSDEDKKRWDELEWSADGSVADEVASEELHQYLFDADTVDQALAALMERGVRVAGGDHLGKSIIFAANNAHADFIAERLDINYKHMRGELAQIISYKDHAQGLVDQFADQAKGPRIAISVDMLDTGIDIPAVVNLVFFRPVRSKTKFEQMIGRGTRLCPDLFGPNRDKEELLVFDLCQNIEFFNQKLMPAEGRLGPSLTERIFASRADLLLALGADESANRDQAEADGQAEYTGVRTANGDGTVSTRGLRFDIAQRLHHEVTGMSPDNFSVRTKIEYVDAFSSLESWLSLTRETHAQVIDHLAGLPTAFRDDDSSEEAKRFDLLALRLQLGVLHADSGFDRLRAQVQEIASALQDQYTIPAVRAQQELIDDLLDVEWWQNVTLPKLEAMRRQLRSLVKLIAKTRRDVVYTDLKDGPEDLEVVQSQGTATSASLTRFEQRLKIYLRAHEDQLAVQKIRRNRQITATDLAGLERILIKALNANEMYLERTRRAHGGLGVFLRSLSGMNREATRRAFEDFRKGRSFNSGQLRYLDMVIDYVARNGDIDFAALYSQPFVSLAPRGPEDLFTEADITSLEAVIKSVRATAVAEDGAA